MAEYSRWHRGMLYLHLHFDYALECIRAQYFPSKSSSFTESPGLEVVSFSSTKMVKSERYERNARHESFWKTAGDLSELELEGKEPQAPSRR